MEYIYCDLAFEVAKYLTPKDISTCCRVSLHWREVFGSNEVWQRLCDSEIEEYLRTTPCVVEPIFQLPQHIGTSLPPLSQWKAAFLREQHLWTNWQNRNFKTVEYDLGNEKNSTEKFVTNDLIMRFLPNSVELWDVRADRPVLKDTISFGKTRWYTPTVLENGFVTLKGYYNNNGNDHYFTEIFKVNQNERSVTLKWYIKRNGKELSLRPGCSEESVKNRFCSVKELNIVITPGGKCIGYLSYPSSNPSYPGGIMHSFCVWDLENGVELRKESIFLPDCFLIIEGCKSSANQCEDVVVILPYPFSTPDRSGLAFGTLEFQVYNANNLKFFPFKKRCTYIDQVAESEYESDYESEYESEYEPDSEKKCREDRTFWVITDGFLALSDCGREGREAKEFIRIFNYQTGHELYKLETNDYNTAIEVIGDTFLFTKNISLPSSYTPGTICDDLFFAGDEKDKLLLCSVSPSGRVCEDVLGSRYIEEFYVVGRTGFIQVLYISGVTKVWRVDRFFNFQFSFPDEGVNGACTKVITTTGPPNTLGISYYW